MTIKEKISNINWYNIINYALQAICAMLFTFGICGFVFLSCIEALILSGIALAFAVVVSIHLYQNRP